MTQTARADDLVITRRGEARFKGRRCPCAVGKTGFQEAKAEGDGASPVGVFTLEYGYYRPDRLAAPKGCLNWRAAGPTDGWSDDPADPLYNRPVRRPRGFHHEHLRRADPLYDIVVVFNANRDPIIPGNGSALFLHVWRRPRFPTEGCIAFDRRDLLWIMERWHVRGRLRLAA